MPTKTTIPDATTLKLEDAASNGTAPVPNVVQALSAVMADVGAVRKGDRNAQQNFNFRGIDSVVNAVSPALRAHGVVVFPVVLDCQYDLVTTAGGKAQTACRVRVRYTFAGPAGDTLETEVIAEAWDSGDKSAPKAMSVAFRTALLQTLALPTDEKDPDAETYERAMPAVAEQTSGTVTMGRSTSERVEGGNGITTKQLGMIGVLMTKAGITEKDAALAYVKDRLNLDRPIGSRKDLTAKEASQLIDALKSDTDN